MSSFSPSASAANSASLKVLIPIPGPVLVQVKGEGFNVLSDLFLMLLSDLFFDASI